MIRIFADISRQRDSMLAPALGTGLRHEDKAEEEDHTSHGLIVCHSKEFVVACYRLRLFPSPLLNPVHFVRGRCRQHHLTLLILIHLQAAIIHSSLPHSSSLLRISNSPPLRPATTPRYGIELEALQLSSQDRPVHCGRNSRKMV